MPSDIRLSSILIAPSIASSGTKNSKSLRLEMWGMWASTKLCGASEKWEVVVKKNEVYDFYFLAVCVKTDTTFERRKGSRSSNATTFRRTISRKTINPIGDGTAVEYDPPRLPATGTTTTRKIRSRRPLRCLIRGKSWTGCPSHRHSCRCC